jgi:signal transduction histidine kinase
VAQLALPAASAATPPPVLITHLHIRGEPYPVADLGEPAIGGIELAADQNLIEVGFFALGFDASRPLRYQYRLEGVDTDWGSPSGERRVTYASLSPGRYQFLVRAIAADRVTTPATVSFVILRPVWQQPWFLTGALALTLLLAAAVHRTRVSRLLAVERMRTRIATDLHDDIGSGLSQIAVLSEVIRQRRPEDPEIARPLDRIATTARELVDSMSELVWAINPRRDSLVDLSQRMRRFASDLLPARGIALTFRAPAGVDEIRLGADVRRHVFLVFKEAVNNLARHSGAAHANLDLSVDAGRLILVVADDGCGFDPAADDRGQGMASMRSRARAAGGTLEIDSAPQRGTRLRLQVPLGRTPWRLRRRRMPHD